MALAPQLNFSDTYVSENGLKPKFRIEHEVYGNSTHIMWVTIGLASSSTYVQQDLGLLGTAYPSARSAHNVSAWLMSLTGQAESDSIVRILSPTRVPSNLELWTKDLTANTEYVIQGWVKYIGHDGGVQTFKRSVTVATTTSDTFTMGTQAVPIYKGVGSNEYVFANINTQNCSASIIHQQGIADNTIDGSTYAWATGVDLTVRGHIRFASSTTMSDTIQGTTSSNETRQYWRLKIKNLVNNNITYFPSSTTVNTFYQTAFQDPLEISDASFLTSSSFSINASVQEHRCSAATMTIQVATNSSFTAGLIDHTSSQLTIGEYEIDETLTESTALTSSELLNGHTKYCLVTGLAGSTEYFVRAKIISTNVPSTVAYSITRRITTTTVKLAVKTPSKHQVGYFFQGNFTAYRKLEKLDMPEFSPSWKSACMINSVAYLGNVKYKDTDGSIVYKPDRILKSLPLQVDTFTKHNFIDVAVEDGDDIIALEYMGEKLMQFKKNKLYIINVGAEYEYLEATFDGVGVSSPSAVCKLPYGVAFVNQSGCYIYDGQKIINLLQKEDKHIINKKVWSDFISDNSMIGYIQEKNVLLITDSAGSVSAGNCYIFDIDAKCWLYYKGGLPASFKTNFITDTTGKTLFASGLSGHYYYPQIEEGGNDEFTYQTKELDFGDPTSLKKIYVITISYANAGMPDQPILTYSTDSGKTFKHTETGGFQNHNENTGWYNATFKLQSPDLTTYNYPTCNTLILRVSTMNILEGYTNFQLNEINVEFRKLHKRLTASTIDTSTVTTGTTSNPSVSGFDQMAIQGDASD